MKKILHLGLLLISFQLIPSSGTSTMSTQAIQDQQEFATRLQQISKLEKEIAKLRKQKAVLEQDAQKNAPTIKDLENKIKDASKKRLIAKREHLQKLIENAKSPQAQAELQQSIRNGYVKDTTAHDSVILKWESMLRDIETDLRNL